MRSPIPSPSAAYSTFKNLKPTVPSPSLAYSNFKNLNELLMAKLPDPRFNGNPQLDASSNYMPQSRNGLPQTRIMSRESMGVRNGLKPPDPIQSSSLDKYKPFVSNLANMFRKPPRMARPNMDSPVTLSGVSLDDQRVNVNRQYAAADKGADQRVDENTALAFKGFNVGARLSDLNTINANETNQNTAIRNQQILANAQIESGNNKKLADWNESDTARKIVQQNEQSANLSNAMDKSVLMDTEKRKAGLQTKYLQLMVANDKDGVLRRMIEKIPGEDPINVNYMGTKTSNKYGGTLGATSILKGLKKYAK